MDRQKDAAYRFVTLGPFLSAYFLSGWVFTIPYLAAYLLYWWQGWPVNPENGSGLCLLHLYWLIHAMNIILAAGAFLWRSTKISSMAAFGKSRHACDFIRFVPWIALALAFYIPSVYFEFPSDPWEHFSRINHWPHSATVGDFYARTKSSYFFAYSLVGRIETVDHQIYWLAVYHTGCCMLLSWQYYRLARGVGLRHRPALIFTVFQAFLFGNNLFSFYRYYSIASTVFAQLGAVVFVRMSIDLIRRGARFSAEGRGCIACLKNRTTLWPFIKPRLSLIGGGVCVLVLIALNHGQALGIAAVGAGSVVVWGIFSRHGSRAWWLLVPLVLMSIGSFLWWPREPAIDAIYRPQNWLTPWLGFNLFNPSSPAWERALAILGATGVSNMLTAVWLLRKNHIVGWLTIAPVVALTLPFVAIPFANILAGTEDSYIVSFNRLLLGIPAGLALVTAMAKLMAVPIIGAGQAGRFKRCVGHQHLAFGTLALVLAALTLLPASGPSHNRLWNALAIIPDDLQMRSATMLLDGAMRDTIHTGNPHSLVTTHHFGFIAFATGIRDIATPAGRSAPFTPTPAARAVAMIDRIAYVAETKQPAILVIQPATRVFSPRSAGGTLSGHWSPEYAVLENVAFLEILEAARGYSVKEIRNNAGDILLFPENSTR